MYQLGLVLTYAVGRVLACNDVSSLSVKVSNVVVSRLECVGKSSKVPQKQVKVFILSKT